MNLFYILSFIIPFLFSILLLPVIRKFAFKIGFLDTPGESKIHGLPVPLGGGVLIFAGFLIAFLSLTSVLDLGDFKSAVGIAAGSTLVMLIGLYHDALRMGAMQKLAGQVISALIFLSFAQKAPPVISIPVYFVLAIIWIVTIQNAFNFLDNMDGLCGGISFTISIGLGLLFIFKDMPLFAIMSFALAGGALGFLRYNLPPAGIFLGDAGSLFFGYAISCLTLIHISTSKSLISALSPLIIVAYPIFDLLFVTFSRLNEGRNVYLGGFDSSSHKITFMGLTGGTTLLIIQLINTALVTIGIAIFFMNDTPYQILLLIVLTFILAFIGTHLYRNILYLRYKIITVIIDLLAINLTFIIYLFIRYNESLIATGFTQLTDFIVPLAWINLFWIVIYSAGGLYDLSFELKFRYQFSALARLVLIGFLIFAAATYQPGAGLQASLQSLILFAALLVIFNSLLRLAYSRVMEHIRKTPRGRLQVVLVRPQSTGSCVSLSHFQARYNIRGYFGPTGSPDFTHLGEIVNVGDYLRENRIARIILDLSPDNFENLNNIFSSAFYMETRFLISNPNMENLRGLRKIATRYDGIYMISLSQRRVFVRFAKRLSDFAISGILLIMTSPYIAINLLFSRLRQVNLSYRVPAVTKGGRDCELWCSTSDSGYYFRNIWGLISVLKGDLSLVGATITPKKELESLHACQGLWRKFLVRPGLFGPGYDAISQDEAFQLDLHYVENATIFYDIGIIFRQILKISSIRKSGSA